MRTLPLTLACDLYDRTAPLFDGRVVPQGIALNYLAQQPVETLWRQLRFAEFDVSEMSLSAYIMEVGRGDPRFIALPVPVVRIFRRGNVYVRKDAGIEHPGDLKGRRVGVPEYHMTAALFIRGFLADDHGVRPEDLEWFQGGQIEPGRKERVELHLPPEVHITHVPDRTLDEMLLAGDLDAIVTGAALASFQARDPRVGQLFEDPRAVDLEAYHRTGIFPIMHIIALRRDVYEANPWVALNLYRAFEEARALVAGTLASWRGGGSVMLPFFQDDLARAQAEMGIDPWPYGIEANRPTFEAAVRYSYEQSLSPRPVSVEELFVPNLVENRV